MKLVISEQSIIIGKYRDSLANFALDYGSAAPALVHPKSHRVYIQGVRHSSHAEEHGQTYGGPLPWPEGDAIITALPTLLTKQTAREKAAQQAAQQAAEAAQAAQQAAEAAQAAQQTARQEAAQQAAQQAAAEAARQAAQAASPSEGGGASLAQRN